MFFNDFIYIYWCLFICYFSYVYIALKYFMTWYIVFIIYVILAIVYKPLVRLAVFLRNRSPTIYFVNVFGYV